MENSTLPKAPIEYLIVSEGGLEKVRDILNKKGCDFSLGSDPKNPRVDFCFRSEEIDPEILSEIREQDIYIQQRI